MATITIEIYLEAEGNTLVAMENAIEGGIVSELVPNHRIKQVAKNFRNQMAWYLGVPITDIEYDYHVREGGSP